MKTPRATSVAVLVCLTALLASTSSHLVGSAPAVGTNQWVAGPPLGAARSGATGIALAEGGILVTGGRDAAGTVASAEIVTPNGTVVAVSPMGVPRAGHAAVRLDDGRVLVVGGTTTVATEQEATEVASNSIEIFDPLANAWAPAGALMAARAQASAFRIEGGRVAIAGGDGSIEIFDPTGSEPSTAITLGAVREGAAIAALRDGRIVVAGGSISGVAQASADIVDTKTGVVATVSLTGPRTGATATATVDGRVLIAGGSDGTNVLATTEILDETGNASSGPALTVARADHQAYLLPNNGGVLLVGGSAGASPEVVIPWTGAVIETPAVNEPRTKTAGGRVAEGAFAVAGGSTAGGAMSAALDYYGFATVKTDKDDYAPGQFVTITGTGWQPGETVNLVLHEVGTGAPDTPLNALVGEDGTFVNDFWAPNESHVGVRLYLTATGAGATAQTTFTDGRPTSVTLVAGQSPSPVTSPGTATYTVGVVLNNQASNCGTTLTAATAGTWPTPPLGGFFSFSPSIVSGSSVTANSQLTVTVPSGTSPGTYLFNVTATGNAGSGCGNPAPVAALNGLQLVVGASNAAPSISSNLAAVTFDEESLASNSGSWSDADAGDTVTLSASVGTVVQAGTNAAGTWSWSYTPGDGPASQTVTITANDGKGGTTATTFSLNVNNVAPTATFGNNGPVNEGTAVTVTFTGQTDPSSADVAAGLRYSYSCSNNPAQLTSYASASTSPSTTCTFQDNGTFPVLGRIIDKDGGFTDYTTNVVVNNVAPSIADGDLSLSATSVNEGSSVNLSGSFTDPGTSDTHTVTIAWGDGSSNTVLNLGAGVTMFGPVAHTFVDDNPSGTASDPSSISVTVTDNDGGSDGAAASVTVNNVAPTVDAGPATATADEGTPFTRSGSFTDPGTGDTWTATVDYGDGTGVQALTLNGDKTFSLNHSYADNGSYTVTVKVNDDDLGEGTDTIDVTVNNVVPVVSAGGNASVDEGAVFTRGGSFTDPGADSWTATVDYGAGEGPQSLTLNADKTFSLSYTYADNGSHTVTVKVADDDTGEGVGSFTVTVNNVAPTATLGNNGPVDEGAAASVSFTDQFDPSSADVSAGLRYSYSCSNNPAELASYASASTSVSTTCMFPDNGTFPVLGRIIDNDGGFTDYTTNVVVNNVAPTIADTDLSLSATAVNEASTVSLSGSFADPGASDTHTVTIAWGDGSANTVLNLAAGVTTFGPVDHTFADDNPTGTASDISAISVTVADDDGGADDAAASVTVNNVAPGLSNLVATPAAVSEGGSTTLTGNVTDPGTLDTFTLSITWGDGSPTQTVSLPAGSTSFSVPHTFVDDNPTGTPSDVHSVSVTVTDDDTGADTETTQVTVNNVAPSLSNLAATPATVNEGASTTLTGNITDPGTLDTFTLSITWGDGSPTQTVSLPAGSTSFSVPHTFVDDNPSGTQSDVHTVSVTVTDDDTGSDTESTQVTVNNVAPSISNLAATTPVSEGSSTTLTGNITDPGTLDTFTLSIMWGDGSPTQTVSLPAGSTSFSVPHAFVDDNPTVTASDVYSVSVTVTDDDGGADTESTQVTVNNVAPSVDAGAATALAYEGAPFTRSGVFSDPGTADTWTGTVDYGDGTGVQPLTLNADKTFGLSHTYDDNGSFTVTVKVKDDDSGEGTATVVVTVNNVAPSATLSNNGPVAEGSATPVTVSFSGATDPSGADTTAGFKYAFRCANNEPELPTTYAAAGTDASTTCTFGDNGSPAVLGRIFDKDNGYSDYTTVVTVTNVAPTKTAATFTFNPYNGAATASVGFSDAGWLDVVGATFDWAGTPSSPDSIGPAAGSGPLTGTFNSTHEFGPGCITAPITVTVSDDDGGPFVHQFAAANTLGQYTSTFMAPLKDGARNIVKLNNVIPVKLIVRDCNGNFVSNRTLSIFVTIGILNVQNVAEGTELIPATSVSGADTTGVMRLADSHYMYNLATKGMTTGLPYTIVIKDGTFVVATAVVEAKK